MGGGRLPDREKTGEIEIFCNGDLKRRLAHQAPLFCLSPASYIDIDNGFRF